MDDASYALLTAPHAQQAHLQLVSNAFQDISSPYSQVVTQDASLVVQDAYDAQIKAACNVNLVHFWIQTLVDAKDVSKDVKNALVSKLAHCQKMELWSSTVMWSHVYEAAKLVKAHQMPVLNVRKGISQIREFADPANQDARFVMIGQPALNALKIWTQSEMIV